MLRYVLTVVTDGRRPLLERTLASFGEMVTPNPAARILIDDSADEAYAHWLDVRYQGFTIIHHPSRRGFAGAVRSGWAQIRKLSPIIDYVLWLEDDFVIVRPVDLTLLAGVLDTHPELAQMALLRQAVNAEERAAGGIMACHPDDYNEIHDQYGQAWVVHRRCFTTNVCLFRRQLVTDHQWPEGALSEGMFTHHLLEDPEAAFAFWGRRDDPPRIHHIGDQRAPGSCGY